MEETGKAKNERFITVAEIADALEEIAPAVLQESWDNSGLLIGFESEPVIKAVTCLDADEDVADEAIKHGAGMIISHHPLIFGDIRSIKDSSYSGRLIFKLIENRISVYSCHTPFDKVKGGNNDMLAELLELSSVKNLNGKDISSPAKMASAMDDGDIGRIGKLRKPMRYMEFIGYAAERLDMSLRELKAVGDMDTDISRVGICTGAGADFIKMAADAGCQVMITGDVRYHQARAAAENGICLLDAGHYGTEKFFAGNMKMKLEKKLGEKVDIMESSVCPDPFKVM